MSIAAVEDARGGFSGNAFYTRITRTFRDAEAAYKWRNNQFTNVRMVTTVKPVKKGQVIGPRQWREEYGVVKF